jgi:bifunctional non-homologous end joining protein LigD
MVVPSYVAPMKAVLGDLPRDDGWTFEIKWDGMRAIACLDRDGTTRLWSGNQIDITHRFPELVDLHAAMEGARCVLDGELIAFNAQGRPSFERMQSRMHLDRPADARRRMVDVPVTFVVFDLLLLDEHDLTALPLSARRAALDEMFETGKQWRLSEQHHDGAALNAAVHEMELEGLMAKRLDSTYLPGKRTTAWRKVKRRVTRQFVVGGWAEGSGGRHGRIGGLLIGGYRDGGLWYAGRVGSGLRDEEIRSLLALFDTTQTNQNPFVPGSVPRPDARVAHWVEPQLVIEVAFAEWTNEGRVRHPVYLGRARGVDPQSVALPQH